jgi:hydroxymethylpyrimidine pyrophosphatase-like HAD family hydrolase
MNRLIQRLGVGIAVVGLLGALTAAPAFADTTSSVSVGTLQQDIFNAQMPIAQVEEDLQALEQKSNYDFQSNTGDNLLLYWQEEFGEAVNASQWSYAEACLNEVQDIENNTASGSTTPVEPTYTAPVTPTYTPPTYTEPTTPTYTQPTDQNQNDYSGQTQQADPYRFLPKDINRNNPVLQQSWAQQYLRQQASSQGSDNNWWFWQYLRQQQQQGQGQVRQQQGQGQQQSGYSRHR